MAKPSPNRSGIVPLVREGAAATMSDMRMRLVAGACRGAILWRIRSIFGGALNENAAALPACSIKLRDRTDTGIINSVITDSAT